MLLLETNGIIINGPSILRNKFLGITGEEYIASSYKN